MLKVFINKKQAIKTGTIILLKVYKEKDKIINGNTKQIQSNRRYF